MPMGRLENNLTRRASVRPQTSTVPSSLTRNPTPYRARPCTQLIGRSSPWYDRASQFSRLEASQLEP
jgi:hypothetical protein